MNPLPVRDEQERNPKPRPQNVALTVEPPGIEALDYYPHSFVTGSQYRALSVWSAPWWLTDEESAPVTGSFSTAFSSAFEGGIESPQGSAYSTAFSSAFGQ